MRKAILKPLALGLVLFLVSISCNFVSSLGQSSSPSTQVVDIPLVVSTPSPAATSPRLLTVCMGSEPTTLFLYADASVAARSIRQAIYDGPFDTLGFDQIPVILENQPTLANGGVLMEAVMVQPGTVIVDANGKLVKLGEGSLYLPSGCGDASCAQAYTGSTPVSIDQQVVRFKLRSGILWSDGAALTADDSLYSFEIASSLYPSVQAEVIVYTQSYQALDATTVEWRGAPGYRDAGYAASFFTPLPRHAWGILPSSDLLSDANVNRSPLGWGPYIIEEWTAGDHISLKRNPNYFRSAEGLPHFDRLVFRFMPDRAQAVAALLAGECDYLDETVMLDAQDRQVVELRNSGRATIATELGTAWEHIDFGLQSEISAQEPTSSTTSASLFQLKETRQAIAMCLDRQRLVQDLFLGDSQVLDSYVPSTHPLFNPQVRRYAYDSQAASALLESIGWRDSDGNPATPRVSTSVAGVPDGASFIFTFLTTIEEEKQSAAQIIQESLAQCGVKMEISSLSWNELFASGAQGPIFGRHFSMTQFGWASAVEPPCYLYTSGQIPGPYPDFPKGWGGANASGYSNPDFDRICQQALSTLPGTPEHQAAHYQAQAIFAEDLPAIPLYLHLKVIAMRPDMCQVVLDASADSALWSLEAFDYGKACAR